MEAPETLMPVLLKNWTEQDRETRRQTFERYFRADTQFHDDNGEFVGYEGLEAFSDSMQERFPGALFTFDRASVISNAVRSFWTFGPPDHPDAASGMDLFLFDGELISHLYVFLEG